MTAIQHTEAGSAHTAPGMSGPGDTTHTPVSPPAAVAQPHGVVGAGSVRPWHLAYLVVGALAFGGSWWATQTPAGAAWRQGELGLAAAPVAAVKVTAIPVSPSDQTLIRALAVIGIDNVPAVMHDVARRGLTLGLIRVTNPGGDGDQISLRTGPLSAIITLGPGETLLPVVIGAPAKVTFGDGGRTGIASIAIQGSTGAAHAYGLRYRDTLALEIE